MIPQRPSLHRHEGLLRSLGLGAAVAVGWLAIAGVPWVGAGCSDSDGGADGLVADGGLPPVLSLPRWVSTLAGSGSRGFADGLATSAQFNLPEGVAVDAAGRVYVADSLNHRIRVIEGRQVRTLAGTGVPGHADGLATAAQFNRPADVAVDPSGERVYVADRLNNAIRLIEGGRVRTVAGASAPGFVDGVGEAARFNWPTSVALLAAWPVGGASDGGADGSLDGGPVDATAPDLAARSATLDGAVDAGDDGGGAPVADAVELFIADSANYRVRRFDGLRVSTFAGGTQGFVDGFASGALFRSPAAVAVDGSGGVYVADPLDHRLRQIAGGRTRTLAGDGSSGFGDGLPSRSQLASPAGVAVDLAAGGDARVIFVADQGNHAIRALVDGALTTVAGDRVAGHADGLGDAARFNTPANIAAVGGKLYVADRGNHRIRVISGALAP